MNSSTEREADSLLAAMRRFSWHVATLVAWMATAGGVGAEEGRFLAQFDSGRRISGPVIESWARPGDTPKLDGEALFPDGDALRWLIDTAHDHAAEPEAFVEMVTGDRVPGVVAGWSQAAASLTVPPHFWVVVHVPLKDSRNQELRLLRVRADAVRRIVHDAAQGLSDEPNTLQLSDARVINFRSLRLRASGVTALTDHGIEKVDFPQIVELCLPERDFWASYFHELAELAPQLQDRLMQVETTSGMIATTSMPRFRPMPYSARDDPNQWFHLIHPAWGLDAFAVRHTDIAARRFFDPTEVPLSRVRPVSEKNVSQLHDAWSARRDTNAYGGPLFSNGQRFGWGWGVHGDCRLELPLPTGVACRFSTTIGIDDAVGKGGCARPQVSLIGTRSTELFAGEELRGASRVMRTGELKIAAAEESSRMVLQVDPLNNEHPDDADPLDLRDAVNWLEPTLSLDREEFLNLLRQRQSQAVSAQIPALDGWTVDSEASSAVRFVGGWNAQRQQGTDYRYAMQWSDLRPFVLAKRARVSSPDAQLIVSVCRPPDAHAARMEVLIGGDVAAQSDVPVRDSGEDEPRPVVVALGPWHEQDIEIKLRLVASNSPPVVDWRMIRIAADAASGESAPPEIWKPAPVLVGHPQIDKEAHNVLLELTARIEAETFDDVAALIVQAPPEMLFSNVPDPDDPRRTSTLGAVFVRIADGHAALRRSLKRTYQELANLRLSRALASKHAIAVEAVAMQFVGTPAAAQAQAWLGNRALSAGRTTEALGRYERSLADLPFSERAIVRERIKIAKQFAESP